MPCDSVSRKGVHHTLPFFLILLTKLDFFYFFNLLLYCIIHSPTAFGVGYIDAQCQAITQVKQLAAGSVLNLYPGKTCWSCKSWWMGDYRFATCTSISYVGGHFFRDGACRLEADCVKARFLQKTSFFFKFHLLLKQYLKFNFFTDESTYISLL